MKGNFWRKLFRSGYNGAGYNVWERHGEKKELSSRGYNGREAKRDPHTSRSKLKNWLKKWIPEKE